MISSMLGFTQGKSMFAVVWPTGGGVDCEGNIGVVGEQIPSYLICGGGRGESSQRQGVEGNDQP